MQQSLLEKLTVPQLVKKLPIFYGTRRFITAFTKARSIQLTVSHTISLRSVSMTMTTIIIIMSRIRGTKIHLRILSPLNLRLCEWYNTRMWRQYSQIPKRCSVLSMPQSRVMAEAVSRRPLASEARVWSRVSLRGICGRQRGTGTGFSPVNFIPPVLH